MVRERLWIGVAAGLAAVVVLGLAQHGASQPPPEKGGDKMFGGPKGGFGGPMGQTRKLVKQFDADKNGWLNKAERKAAREFLKKERSERGGGKGGFGGFGGPKGGPGGGMRFMGPPQPGTIMPEFIRDQLDLDAKQKKDVDALQKDVDEKLAKILTDEQKKTLKENPFGMMGGPPMMGGPGGRREPGRPGPKITPDEVKQYTAKDALYEPTVLRTVFLEFTDSDGDWEAEMADFKDTDIELPATLTVDGKKYPLVGVHFRGMSSFMMTPNGSKRSLGLTMDLVDKKQRLYGYKTLNLLNGADDPSFLHTILCSLVSREHIPTPKANLMKVAINGESWGVYVNVQQFNKEFTEEFFKSGKGTRWKVRGNPGGASGLEFTGENLEDYKRRFTIKTKDDEKAWTALRELCRTLNKTPVEKLEAALKPMLDIEGALWFLALDVALVNNDGYWTRASDYSLYLDPKGKFHLIPHDMNETFMQPMGFGMGPGGPGGPGGGRGGPGGPGGGSRDLDPLVGLNNSRMPLRSKLLAVPALREKYLKNVREIADKQLDWKKLGPVVEQYRKLVEKDVEADTRKLYTLAAFKAATSDAEGAQPGASLRGFVERRREYLLGHDEIKKLK